MKKLLLILFLTICPIFSFGQITIDSEPYSLKNEVRGISPQTRSRTVVPNKSIAEALVEDEIDEQMGLPPRFGLKKETNFTTENSGVWNELPNGDKLWRLAIKSPGAKSINLIYDKFHLPPGGVLHIYNADKSHIIGGFTMANNKGSLETPGRFGTGLVYGDMVILEYYHATDVKQNPIISISKVIHGYKFIPMLARIAKESGAEVGYGDSGSCMVNVNCPEGNNWQDEERGVAMIMLDDGTRFCSGSLLNNTSEDGTPYFLTANHCLMGLDAEGNNNASDWVFVWNYESPNCQNGFFEPQLLSTAGATLRANNGNTDFALFELTESPLEAGYDVYYNGWDRNVNLGAGGVGIHHPAGDVKKISTFTQVPNPSNYPSQNNYWSVDWVATANGHSVTEGGSSGSSLFTNNGRIIGQLFGGSIINPNCSDPANDVSFYGRFNVSWDGATSTRRLRDWLDPTSSNPMYLNGVQIVLPSIQGDDCVCNSPNETFTAADTDGPVTWSFPSSLLTQVSANGFSITLRAKDTHVRGTAILTARDAGTNAIVAEKEIYVGKPATPYGNIQGDFTTSHGALENYNYYSTVAGATSYDWWLPYPYISTNTVYTNPSKWSRLYGSGTTKNLRSQVGPNNGLIQFMGVNKCGRGGAKINNVTVSSGGGGPQPLMADINDFESLDLEFETIMVYPNPTKNELSIFMSPEYRNTVHEIAVFDLTGRLIYHSTDNSVERINVTTYPAGLYSIQVKSNNGRKTKMIAIER
ncbi:MAG: hypothetical protein CMH48_03990 [Muricauda sp.]|jgi:hypothetical protein|nr:T9SS type A sorting domain-containing protein [Allomuricauda sp.]MAU17655.1 hypothetical protein [Allomuricauda sp.]MBC29986.1 hypothetical protein [Allomuricauda sp.]|tara:strand:- start:110756 stop:113017 length:2262 start_codon:yes stop_codon:yes gene_type:complete